MQVYETLKLHPGLIKQTVRSWFRRFRRICTLSLNDPTSKLVGHISGNVVEKNRETLLSIKRNTKTVGAQIESD